MTDEAPAKTSRQLLEQWIAGDDTPGLTLLSRTLLSELDALNARLNVIEKRLPVIKEYPRICSNCVYRASELVKHCNGCVDKSSKPNFVLSADVERR